MTGSRILDDREKAELVLKIGALARQMRESSDAH